MGSDVDAVVAALKIALKEAESSTAPYWKVSAANRWIDRLPGAWLGRWRHLRLSGSLDTVVRSEFVGHVRAVLAYLETNREAASRTLSWRRPRSMPPALTTDRKPTSKGSRLVH